MMESFKTLWIIIFIMLLLQGIQWGVIDTLRSSRGGTIVNLQEYDFSSAADKVKPSVVGIVVTRYEKRSYGDFYDYFIQRFFDLSQRPTREVRNMGSGFVIDSSGYILTSYHVVAGAQELTVNFPTGDKFHGKLIGLDSLTDLAVLKVDAPANILHPVSFADSDNLKVGQLVLAVGNPFLNFFKNPDPTVTVGVVSALHRNFRYNRNFFYQDMIQTDAAINPGNSGGPLIDRSGRVIGVNAFIYTGDERGSGSIGLGFAIPSRRAIHIARELISFGRRRPVWTGLYLYQSNGSDGLEPGLYVHSVKEESPSCRVGLVSGDRIISIDRREVMTASDLSGVLLPYFPGDTVNIRIRRGEHIFSLMLPLGEAEE